MPTFPRNASSKGAKTNSQRQRKTGWKGLTLGDLKNFGQKIKDHFKWKHTPREFQLEAISAQLLRKDVLIHAGTGSGKTFVAAGPHAHEATKGMVTFMVSPLIALQEEQVSSYKMMMVLLTCLTGEHLC
jgi:superfamily II DNA helicase RecQ